MARICIVTPGAIGSNPRVVKEAGALIAAGHVVHVISVRTLDVVDRLDDSILATAEWSSYRIDFRRPAARLLPKLRQSISRFAYRRWGRAPEQAYAAVTASLVRRASAWPADLYIAHYVAALPAAQSAALAHGAIFAFDAEDFHLGDLPEDDRHAEEKALIRRIEGDRLHQAAYVSAASRGIAEAYSGAYGVARPVVVRNVFPKAEAPSAPSPAGSAAPGPSLYWFSQTIGAGRGLEIAVEAVSLAVTAPHLYLRGTPAAGYRQELNDLAARFGVEDRLHWLDPADPDQMSRLASAYDVGFVGETGQTFNRSIALTNKQFTYVLGGVPALLSDIPAHADFAPEAQGAVALYGRASPTKLAQAIDAWLGDPAKLSTARQDAYRLGQERFNWEIEQTVLVERVNAALSGAGGGAA